MKRIYTNNGEGISTKVTNTVNGKKYIISTAKDPRGFWQLAVFKILFDIPYIYGKVDHSNVYPGPVSKTFKEAEGIHYKAEELIANRSPETWLYDMANWDFIENDVKEEYPDSDELVGSDFIDKNGKKWAIVDATIKEVEEHTDIQYHKIDKVRSIEDQKNTEKNYTATDYLAQLKQSEPKEKEAIQNIYSSFQGKPNNENILKEKALILAKVLLQTIRLHTEGFAELGTVDKNPNGDTKEKFISLGELFVEIASVYLSYIDRVAVSVLSKQNREVFIDTLQEEFIASALLENYREDAYSTKNAFISDLNKCLEAYAKFPFYPKENQGEKGTLLWEFANNVAKIVGKEKHILFIELIIHTVLRDIDILQLEKLLPKEK